MNILSTTKVYYQSQSMAEFTCAVCKRGFQSNELRQHTIEISSDNQRVLKQTVVHVLNCLDQHLEQEKKAVYERVVPANRHIPPLQTKHAEWLEKNCGQYIHLARLYPEAIVYPATIATGGINNGYWLDFPQVSSISTELCNLGFNLFKALFTVVCAFELQLNGSRVAEFIKEIKSKLVNNSELKASCSCWLWTYQVAGTSDTFRVVAVFQPPEKDLVQAYNWQENEQQTVSLRSTEVQTDSKLNEPFQLRHEALTHSTIHCIGIVQQHLGLCANTLKLNLSRLDLVYCSSMCYGQSAVRDRQQMTRFRFHFNCQASQNGEVKDFYLFPHSDIQSTDLLYYTGKTADPVPLFYENNIQETEKEMERAGLVKQLLTNYQLIMAHYPRAIMKPTTTTVKKTQLLKI